MSEMRRDDERGQITVMTIGFLVFLGLLMVVVINASQAFLERRELDNLADGAALVAADGLDTDGFYRDGAIASTPVDARALVGSYLSGTDVRILSVHATANGVTVQLERTVDLAIRPPGLPARTTVRAEATSQLRY